MHGAVLHFKFTTYDCPSLSPLPSTKCLIERQYNATSAMRAWDIWDIQSLPTQENVLVYRHFHVYYQHRNMKPIVFLHHMEEEMFLTEVSLYQTAQRIPHPHSQYWITVYHKSTVKIFSNFSVQETVLHQTCFLASKALSRRNNWGCIFICIWCVAYFAQKYFLVW